MDTTYGVAVLANSHLAAAPYSDSPLAPAPVAFGEARAAYASFTHSKSFII